MHTVLKFQVDRALVSREEKGLQIYVGEYWDKLKKKVNRIYRASAVTITTGCQRLQHVTDTTL